MLETTQFNSNQDSRILLLSLRHLKSHVSRCYSYEFEDTIRDLDTVDVVVPTFSPSWFKVTNRLGNYIGKAVGSCKFINPLFHQIKVNKNYDLFFVICQSPFDIICINSLKGWRENCSKAILVLDEIWAKEIPNWKAQLHLLKDFDYVLMNFTSSIEQVASIIQRPCHSIPFGVDAVKFCPYPLQPERHVDVYSIGRRSQVTHKALLDLAGKGNFFYMYETLKDLYMIDYNYHRSLYSNILKRSRYFIANKAKFDGVNETGGQEELGARFFEGAAAGAVMLGSPPACNAYSINFDWQDAVISIPYDVPSIGEVIVELNTQPERLQKIRTNNVVNSLLRHDWVYRWGKILDTVGLEHTEKMRLREAYLQNLAKMVLVQENKVEKLQAAVI